MLPLAQQDQRGDNSTESGFGHIQREDGERGLSRLRAGLLGNVQVLEHREVDAALRRCRALIDDAAEKKLDVRLETVATTDRRDSDTTAAD
ncbi:hypothetical protein F66182_1082 [Fusarium sp. NRRL 66182]|nr:hypothetical protein F66182_1082 [Fusarium sp. NRRL 66182]